MQIKCLKLEHDIVKEKYCTVIVFHFLFEHLQCYYWRNLNIVLYSKINSYTKVTSSKSFLKQIPNVTQFGIYLIYTKIFP